VALVSQSVKSSLREEEEEILDQEYRTIVSISSGYINFCIDHIDT
jgi:hypothetical protein